MSKPFKKMLLGVSIFFGIVFGWYGVKKAMFFWFMSHYKPPAVTISTAKAKSSTWQPYLTAVGTVCAKQGVEIASEVPGMIDEIYFHSGDAVKKGDVLVVLRSDVEKAALKNSLAKLELAKLNYEREKTLNHKKFSSQANLDLRHTEWLFSQANVESIEAQIRQKRITAPFDGKLGIRQVNLGQFISPGMPIVSLQALNPLYVLFSLPEQYLPALTVGQTIDVSLNLGEGKKVTGKIKAINTKVEAATRNILIEAQINNDQADIYPGMYGLVNVWLKQNKPFIVLPQTAVSYSLSGDYVFVIKNEGKADAPSLHAYRQYVKTGERRSDEVAILEGLNPDQEVVTAGQLKLQNGSQVLINNDVKL